MNVRHFLAIVRLRWQMATNQFRKSSTINRVVSMVLTVLAALGSLGAFVFAVGWGRVLLSKIEPFQMIFVWDAIVGIFLFAWAIALMVELQKLAGQLHNFTATAGNAGPVRGFGHVFRQSLCCCVRAAGCVSADGDRCLISTARLASAVDGEQANAGNRDCCHHDYFCADHAITATGNHGNHRPEHQSSRKTNGVLRRD